MHENLIIRTVRMLDTDLRGSKNIFWEFLFLEN